MANVNNPDGFTPVRHLSGGTIRLEELPIASATTGNIFTGDLVSLLGTGYITVGTAITTTHVGVFAGCRYRRPTGEMVYSNYYPTGYVTMGSEDIVGYVYADPNIVFAAQCEGTALFADNGNFMDLTVDVAGSTLTGRSSMEINENAASTNVIRQLGLQKVEGNAFGVNGRVECMIALHSYNAAAGVTI